MGLASADITVLASDGTQTAAHVGVGVVARNGRARIHTRGGSLLTDRMGVTRAERVSRTAWLVTFEDGETWQVDRSTVPCGCGGRKA